MLTRHAKAGDCDDPIAGNNDGDIICPAPPSFPDDDIGLDLGNDTLTVNSGVTADYVSGDGLDDGSPNTGNGGDDHITIDGTITCVDGDNTDGDGGDDTIIVNGTVNCEVAGDNASGNGGDDRITINGTVGSDVVGDFVGNHGGHDTITINGSVGGDVIGDLSFGDGGNDTITINGSVSGNVYGDGAFGAGGDDTVILGHNASAGGILDGEDGFDTLQFEALTQSQLAGLDPASGTITFGGHTYTWLNFEQLIGLLRVLSEAGVRILFQADHLLAIDQLDGIAVFAEHGRIAFISFAVVKGMGMGEQLTFSTPNAAGWYVVVTNLGVNPANHANNVFQVQIFDSTSSVAGSFTFSE